jgi:hypothetical protein
MWFRGQHVPILSGSSRKDIFGSEDWVTTRTVQRIGASIFAMVFFCTSVALFVASPYIRVRNLARHGGISGQVFGTVLAVLAVLMASGAMFVAFRLARAVVHSLYR